MIGCYLYGTSIVCTVKPKRAPPGNIKSCTVLMLWYIHHIVYIYASIFIHTMW